MSKYVKPEGTWIYFLSGPDGIVRYVGKAVDPEGRYANHLRYASLKSRRPSKLWIARLLAEGHKPTMTLVEFCRGDGCAEEIHHLRLARSDGLPLLNITEGGEGTLGHKHTPESRAKMSESHKGHVWTPEAKAKLSASLKGIERTPEWRRKIGEAHRGKTISIKQREAVSLAQRGRKHTAEHREKHAAKMRGRKLASEHVAKSSAGHRLAGGDPLTRETAMSEVRSRIAQLGWSTYRCAAACGVSQMSIVNWKRGKQLPTLSNINKMWNGLGIITKLPR